MPKKRSTSNKKYSKAAEQEVHKEMHEFKQGKAHSGKGHAQVKSRKQAVAIGLSKAREKGEKVPNKSNRSSSNKSNSKSSR